MKALALALVLASSLFGQSIAEKIAKVEKPKDIISSYDKFKDETAVSVKGIAFGSKVNPSRMYSIGIGIKFWVKGQTLKDDVSWFLLSFEQTSRDWMWLDHSGLIILADGEKIDLGKGSRHGDIFLGGVTERVYYELTREQLEKLVKADKIEVQVGSFEGEITDRSLARTRRKMKEILEIATH